MNVEFIRNINLIVDDITESNFSTDIYQIMKKPYFSGSLYLLVVNVVLTVLYKSLVPAEFARLSGLKLRPIVLKISFSVIFSLILYKKYFQVPLLLCAWKKWWSSANPPPVR